MDTPAASPTGPDAPRFVLTAEQIDLLADVGNHPILATFTEPQNPSEAARRLDMPANRLHYHVGKLADAGLLVEDERNGRSTRYRTVATRFLVPRELAGRFELALPAAGRDALERLTGAFEGALERHLRTHLGVEEAGEGFVYDLQPGLAADARIPFAPTLRVLEVAVPAERYAEALERIAAVLEELRADGPDDGGRGCTFAVAAFGAKPSDG